MVHPSSFFIICLEKLSVVDKQSAINFAIRCSKKHFKATFEINAARGLQRLA